MKIKRLLLILVFSIAYTPAALAGELLASETDGLLCEHAKQDKILPTTPAVKVSKQDDEDDSSPIVAERAEDQSRS